MTGIALESGTELGTTRIEFARDLKRGSTFIAGLALEHFHLGVGSQPFVQRDAESFVLALLQVGAKF